MKKIIAILWISFFVAVFSGESVSREWVESHYTKREVLIPMRDGVQLFTAVYEPTDKSKEHPVLMVRTPYSVSPYGEKFRGDLWSAWMGKYTEQNYIIVFQDVRGRYMSEGSYVNVRPYINKKEGKETDESTDVYDTAEWIVQNTSNNGNIGVTGVSYPGFYATMAALSGHPAIKAVSPQAPVCNWFIGDDVHHNGAFMLMDSYSFLASMGRNRKAPSTKMESFPSSVKGDPYDYFLSVGTIDSLTRILAGRVPYWDEVVSHPNYDSYWKSTDPSRHCKNIKPAVLIVGGLFDAEDCYGAWSTYKAIRDQSPKTPLYLAFGPWYHGGWHNINYKQLGNIWFGAETSKYFIEKIEYPFFRYYLEGKGEVPKSKIKVFSSGVNRWNDYTEWPSKEVRMRPYYLNANSVLSELKNFTAEESTSYVSNPQAPIPFRPKNAVGGKEVYMVEDQRFLSSRTDVVTFTTASLCDTLALAGPIEVDLYVRLSSTDADFVVKVIDVFPEGYSYSDEVKKQMKDGDKVDMSGYQMLVRGNIFRGKYRKAFDKPKSFRPGKVERVRFTLEDMSHTFLPGHKVMVQIQSSWFPLVDRNPQQYTNIYNCPLEMFVPCTVELMHSKRYPSQVRLPVIGAK